MMCFVGMTLGSGMLLKGIHDLLWGSSASISSAIFTTPETLRQVVELAEQSDANAQRKYGYPPDMEKLATETVLRQAELIAVEISNS